MINARLISPGLSTFADNKACTEYENSGRKICDDEVVLRLNSENPLTIVNLEDFFTKFDGNALSSVRDKCDLMLYDNVHNRLAFCEFHSCAKITFFGSNIQTSICTEQFH